MSMPKWWGERRYGLFVHSSLAAVPAWAPIGQYSDCYQSHLGEDIAELTHHPKPMVEVLAHHRDRWGHIEDFADFLPLLTFDHFDAEDWARLAVDAGMGYTVFVSKYHDGWCWWDAPNTRRTMVRGGPYRNVMADYAAACERNDITFGTYYSLLDWADPRYPTTEYANQVLHPHVIDLVERYGSNVLWGDGNRTLESDNWRTSELLEQMQKLNPELVVNDRWGAVADGLAPGGSQSLRTFEYSTPDDILDEPWELCRGIGPSFGNNRAERAEHHMSGYGIVSLLTEVVAKGGNLLLSVGPDLDGSIPRMQSDPLRNAGEWIRSHDALISRSTPWDEWGDEDVRYLSVDGALHAIDLSGRGQFAALDPDRCRVDDIRSVSAGRDGEDGAGSALMFHQDEGGLHVNLPRPSRDRHGQHDQVADIAVYRIGVSEPERPVELFAPEPRQPIPLEPLFDDVSTGDILQLGDGTYYGPITVPPGIVVRGLGPGRTIIDGGGEPAVQLQSNARLEHLTVAGGPERVNDLPSAVVEIVGQSATVLGCEIEGHLMVGADGVLIRATSAAGVVSSGSDRLTVSRCQLSGMGWDIGINIVGGGEHEIDSCEMHDHLCAIRVADTTGTIIRGNNISARWWGIHLQLTERAHVYGNHIDHTMRAVDVDGGTQALIDGNAVADGDSGCIVEWGASGSQVSGNCWERCRIGLLAWDTTGLHEQDNLSIDLHETDHSIIYGP
jgi:alpha-L-fucosidase